MCLQGGHLELITQVSFESMSMAVSGLIKGAVDGVYRGMSMGVTGGQRIGCVHSRYFETVT